MFGLPQRRWGRRLVALSALMALIAVLGTGGARPASLSTAPGAEGAVNVSVDTADPGAPINEALLGIDGPGPSAATADVASLGMTWDRTDVSFQDSKNYDCSTFTWTGTDLDQRLLQIWAEGSRPLLIVDYTPSCLVPLQYDSFPPGPYSSYEPPDVGTQPNGTSDKTIWDSAVSEMTKSVLEFAKKHGKAGAGTAPAFEIWNEPDGIFWYGGLPGYLNLYDDTAPVIEQAAAIADPNVHIQVGGPALFFNDPSWIEPFLAYVSAAHLPLDFFSWHYYADYPGSGPVFAVPSPVNSVPPNAPVPYWYNPLLRAQTYGLQVKQVQAELTKYPSLHPALFIDEWNIDAGYDARQDGPYDAAFVAAVFDSVQSAGLNRMAFFNVANDSPDTTGNWGLLFDNPGATPQYTPKPAYWSFAFWRELVGAQLPVSLSPDQTATDPIGRVGAVASSKGATVRVLLYNFVPYDPTGNDGTSDPTPYDHEIAVSLSGLRPHTTYRYCIQLVDGAQPNPGQCSPAALSASGALTMNLPGDAIALITLSPMN